MADTASLLCRKRGAAVGRRRAGPRNPATVDECRQIVKAAVKSRKSYMIMETAIYTREFLYIRELRDTGKLGRIQFMRGCHQQEMAGWPGYWEGLPPMHYATHAVSPCLALVRGEADARSADGVRSNPLAI
jgi:predicted dehydrogenase